MDRSVARRFITRCRTRGVSATISDAAKYLYSGTGAREIYFRLQYRQSDGRVTSQIDDTGATFQAGGFYEFKRYKLLMNEGDVIRDVLREIRPDDVFFDIGANTGIYSGFVGQRLDDGVVVAFEPAPSNIKSLRRNLDLNASSYQIQQLALSDHGGDELLELHGDEPGMGEHRLTTGDTSTETVQIDVAAGDSLVAAGDVPAPNVLKIDVEGAEYTVIKGLMDSLARPECRVIYCEVHPSELEDSEGSYDELLELLEEAGFEIKGISSQGGMRSYIKGTKPGSETVPS